jgi:integral membrane protein (TIGR01906 family)
MLFASLLTTKQYLWLSKDKYASHEDITFDHAYVSDRIMGYLNYRYDDLLIGPNEDDNTLLFREVEISHMEDVKDLYTTLRLTGLGGLIIGVSLSFYIYKKDRREFYKTFQNLYVGPMIFIVTLGSYIIIDFQSAFTKFHELFFDNNDWQLYSTDALIQLLPLEFWLVSAVLILLLFSCSLALLRYLSLKWESKHPSNL